MIVAIVRADSHHGPALGDRSPGCEQDHCKSRTDRGDGRMSPVPPSDQPEDTAMGVPEVQLPLNPTPEAVMSMDDIQLQQDIKVTRRIRREMKLAKEVQTR